VSEATAEKNSRRTVPLGRASTADAAAAAATQLVGVYSPQDRQVLASNLPTHHHGAKTADAFRPAFRRVQPGAQAAELTAERARALFRQLSGCDWLYRRCRRVQQRAQQSACIPFAALRTNRWSQLTINQTNTIHTQRQRTRRSLPIPQHHHHNNCSSNSCSPAWPRRSRWKYLVVPQGPSSAASRAPVSRGVG
jgi:hypothetical protein